MSEKNQSPLEIPELRTQFVFQRRPTSIPADLRPAWRIGLIVLLLKHCCRAERASLAKLHVLNWGLRSTQGRDRLIALATGKLSPGALVVRFEPFLIQAVDFALAENLICRDGGNRVKLIERGKTLAQELDAQDAVFLAEKRVMSIIRTKISEDLVNKLLSGGNFT